MMSSSYDYEREQKVGVKNEENEEISKIFLTRYQVLTRAHTHTHTHIYKRKFYHQFYHDDSRRTRRGERDLRAVVITVTTSTAKKTK